MRVTRESRPAPPVAHQEPPGRGDRVGRRARFALGAVVVAGIVIVGIVVAVRDSASMRWSPYP